MGKQEDVIILQSTKREKGLILQAFYFLLRGMHQAIEFDHLGISFAVRRLPFVLELIKCVPTWVASSIEGHKVVSSFQNIKV